VASHHGGDFWITASSRSRRLWNWDLRLELDGAGCDSADALSLEHGLKPLRISL
jgi:hypothetical protein